MPRRSVNLPACLSISDVAERIGVSTKTITRAIAAGELHAHRVGRLVRIAEDDDAAFLAARRR